MIGRYQVHCPYSMGSDITSVSSVDLDFEIVMKDPSELLEPNGYLRVSYLAASGAVHTMAL